MVDLILKAKHYRLIAKAIKGVMQDDQNMSSEVTIIKSIAVGWSDGLDDDDNVTVEIDAGRVYTIHPIISAIDANTSMKKEIYDSLETQIIAGIQAASDPEWVTIASMLASRENDASNQTTADLAEGEDFIQIFR